MSTNFAVPLNNRSTTVGVNGYTANSNTLLLAAGAGTNFPALTGGQYYRVTVCQVAFAYSPTASLANYTIYKATAISTDTLTLVSGTPLEGTSDRNYATGDIVEIRVTSGTLSDIHVAVNNLEFRSNEVSVTGTTALTSAAFGTTQLCSGTSANYTVTLPAPVAGGIIAFRMASGLTKLVTIAQHSADLVDGVASRVMWANEAATLVSDGTNWSKVAGKSIPMACSVFLQSSQGQISIPNAGGGTVIPTTGHTLDNTGGLMYGSSGGGSINILRSGNYNLYCFVTMTATSGANSGFLQSYLFVNGATSTSSALLYIPVSDTYPQAALGTFHSGTAGDYWQLGTYQAGLNGGSAFTTNGTVYAQSVNGISVVEVTSW